MKCNFLTILALLCFITSCTYSPDETYFKEIILNTEVKGQISLNSYDDKSSILIYGPTVFSYDCTEFEKINKLEVIFNSKVLVSNGSPSGVFTIDNSLLRTGLSKLRIQILAPSQSGSLADKVGAEKFQVWREWDLEADIGPPPSPILELSTENNFLKLSWTPYTKPNFKEYQVSIGGLQIIITDPKHTSYLVKDYVGGYFIQCNVQVLTNLSASQSNLVKRDDQVKLVGQYRYSDGTVLLTWSKADFSGDFKSYSILENGIERPELVNVSDTSVRFRPSDVIFGLPLNFYVRVNSLAGSSPISENYQVVKSIDTPTLDPLPNSLRFNNSLNAIIGISWNDKKLIRYDEAFNKVTEKTVSSLSENFIAPYGGVYVYLSDLNGAYQLNLETDEKKYITISPLILGDIVSSPFIVSASENQIVTFGYQARDISGGLVNHSMVYNMMNNEILYHSQSSGFNEHASIPIISNTGSYLKILDKIYKLNGSNLEIQCEIPNGNGFLGFRPDNEDEFFMISSNIIYIYNSNSGIVKRTVSPPEPDYFFVEFDAGTKSVLYNTNRGKKCYAINIDTLQPLVIGAFSEYFYGFRFINGYLVDIGGSYFKAVN